MSCLRAMDQRKYLPYYHRAKVMRQRVKGYQRTTIPFLDVTEEASLPKALPKKKGREIQVHLAREMNVKRGDLVQVLFGKDQGKHGVVRHVLKKKNQLVVSGCNMTNIFWRPTPLQLGQLPDPLSGPQKALSSLVTTETPIHITNVAPLDPVIKKPTRIKRRYMMNGECVRISKVSGCAMPNPVQPEDMEDQGDSARKVRSVVSKSVMPKSAPVSEKYALKDKKHFQMLVRVANQVKHITERGALGTSLRISSSPQIEIQKAL